MGYYYSCRVSVLCSSSNTAIIRKPPFPPPPPPRCDIDNDVNSLFLLISICFFLIQLEEGRQNVVRGRVVVLCQLSRLNPPGTHYYTPELSVYGKLTSLPNTHLSCPVYSLPLHGDVSPRRGQQVSRTGIQYPIFWIFGSDVRPRPARSFLNSQLTNRDVSLPTRTTSVESDLARPSATSLNSSMDKVSLFLLLCCTVVRRGSVGSFEQVRQHRTCNSSKPVRTTVQHWE